MAVPVPIAYGLMQTGARPQAAHGGFPPVPQSIALLSFSARVTVVFEPLTTAATVVAALAFCSGFSGARTGP
jgi:hypothetical protein